jgi:hypothetical protein
MRARGACVHELACVPVSFSGSTSRSDMGSFLRFCQMYCMVTGLYQTAEAFLGERPSPLSPIFSQIKKFMNKYLPTKLFVARSVHDTFFACMRACVFLGEGVGVGASSVLGFGFSSLRFTHCLSICLLAFSLLSLTFICVRVVCVHVVRTWTSCVACGRTHPRHSKIILMASRISLAWVSMSLRCRRDAVVAMVCTLCRPSTLHRHTRTETHIRMHAKMHCGHGLQRTAVRLCPLPVISMHARTCTHTCILSADIVPALMRLCVFVMRCKRRLLLAV